MIDRANRRGILKTRSTPDYLPDLEIPDVSVKIIENFSSCFFLLKLTHQYLSMIKNLLVTWFYINQNFKTAPILKRITDTMNLSP